MRTSPGAVTAAVALDLSGRFAPLGRQAAAGLGAWARATGVRLTVEDTGADPWRTARVVRHLATRADLLFGPYGSGSARAVAAALEERPWVLWNHGGAALEEPRGAVRVVDVLGPADRYWTGLADVLAARGTDMSRVWIVRSASGFGRVVAEGATRSMEAAGHRVLGVSEVYGPGDARAAAASALRAGAVAVIGCGRVEDDLALGRELAGSGVTVGLVVCGVDLAARVLGPAVEGWIAPAQWWPGGPAPPLPLPALAEYPAAQAMAAGILAARALRTAGSADPSALWAAATAMRTSTFLGPFAIDPFGRQVAHVPVIVEWRRHGDALVREAVWTPPVGPA